MNLRHASCIVSLAALMGAAASSLRSSFADEITAVETEASAPAATQSRPNGPRLLAEEPVHDWGEVREGTEIRWTFKLTNPGTEVARIQKARTSCGCGAFDFTREIPPGGDGHVSILIPSERIHPGRLRASITLTTDAKGDDLLVLQGNVSGAR